LEPPVGEAQYLTAADTRPMTPAYSSPEQVAGGSVTTATDVYQLGLLLTEMLTGRGPARQELGIDDRGLPSRPPSKVKARAELPYPVRELRGDLDWIMLRALEPAPEDRYVSASELLADIERYQRNLPVAARTWTAAYVARKFIRRRPGMALAAGIAGVGLVGYAVLVGYFNVSLEQERAAAIEAAIQAEETRDLLIRFLTSPDPYSGTGADTKVTDLLLHSEAVLTEEFQHRPQLQAELLGSLADVYQNLSLSDRAIDLRERELHTRRGIEAQHSLPSLIARRKLATARVQAGATQEALDELKVVLAELEVHHPDDQLETARVKSDIGTVLVAYGDTAEARRYLEDAVQVLRENGSEPLDLAKAYSALGYVFEDLSLRLEHIQAAHELHIKHQGPDHPSSLSAAAQVAATLTDMGRYQESLERYETLIPAMEKAFGPLHDQTMGVLNNRAVTLYFAGEVERAVGQHKEILDRRRQKHGNAHPEVAASLQNIGALQVNLGHHQEAITALTEAAEIYAGAHLPGSPIIAYPHISLAGLYSELGRTDDLERHARRAIGLLEGNVSASNVALLKSQCLLGDALIRKGQPEEGIPMVRQAIDGMTGQTRLSPWHIEQCREILQRTP
ncbi:MAG: tetratricopeptide repeat protein, partial [Lysobacterales bacterium]